MSNGIIGAMFGAFVAIAAYAILSSRKLDNARTTVPADNQTNAGKTTAIAALTLMGLALLVLRIGAAMLLILLVYGVIVLIFRNAFGIELPIPF